MSVQNIGYGSKRRRHGCDYQVLEMNGKDKRS